MLTSNCGELDSYSPTTDWMHGNGAADNSAILNTATADEEVGAAVPGRRRRQTPVIVSQLPPAEVRQSCRISVIKFNPRQKERRLLTDKLAGGSSPEDHQDCRGLLSEPGVAGGHGYCSSGAGSSRSSAGEGDEEKVSAHQSIIIISLSRSFI